MVQFPGAHDQRTTAPSGAPGGRPPLAKASRTPQAVLHRLHRHRSHGGATQNLQGGTVCDNGQIENTNNNFKRFP